VVSYHLLDTLPIFLGRVFFSPSIRDIRRSIFLPFSCGCWAAGLVLLRRLHGTDIKMGAINLFFLPSFMTMSAVFPPFLFPPPLRWWSLGIKRPLVIPNFVKLWICMLSGPLLSFATILLTLSLPFFFPNRIFCAGSPLGMIGDAADREPA